jgi:hypothetical protein
VELLGMTAQQQVNTGSDAAEVVAPDIDILETIADWKEDLQARIRRTELRFELLDAELDFSDLQEEVADFVRTCRALMWRPPAC